MQSLPAPPLRQRSSPAPPSTASGSVTLLELDGLSDMSPRLSASAVGPVQVTVLASSCVQPAPSAPVSAVTVLVLSCIVTAAAL